eukprot:COSAG02_NODE_1949_length_10291_cov_176.843505_3_plen_51_part_00
MYNLCMGKVADAGEQPAGTHLMRFRARVRLEAFVRESYRMSEVNEAGMTA